MVLRAGYAFSAAMIALIATLLALERVTKTSNSALVGPATEGAALAAVTAARATIWVLAAPAEVRTKAVVASCVVFVATVAVGAAGIPVNVGAARGAAPIAARAAVWSAPAAMTAGFPVTSAQATDPTVGRSKITTGSGSRFGWLLPGGAT